MHVELIRALTHLFKHQNIVRERIANARVEAKASLPQHGTSFRRGFESPLAKRVT